ncbi:MAG TPA: LLM class flavin-dependent oxidoreductase [Candidatus Dormibacteraeota bacterium]|jgi:alkanesulfonate monooxygenase SsuD/methylene tetrahydromethanopterin reductase-like flavin-dependent oxidoreductase (luciferase family)|nr:LLM class flavin-dependent oxidoreductase [Candidatus Dormibacteraeota bacterium]
MKLGVFVPSYLLPGQDRQHGEQIRRFAARAEELGFASLFITDHLLTARRFYRVSWTEPLMTLSHVAAVTSRILLGTSVLVLPTRHPVVLAKEIATLQHLSGDRYIYGVGTGWYPPEFEATGGRRVERGRRTDEVLEASMRLLSGARQSFEGGYYRFREVTVEPLGHRPLVWVAGGRQLAHEASPDANCMDPRVLQRICRWDGWIARPTSPPGEIALDLAEIDAELHRQGTSRPARSFTVAHENFCWLTERTRRDEVIAEQRQRMLAVVSEERPWEYIETVYLVGTIDEIQQRIQQRIDVGVEHLFLHTMTADLSQLELFAKHLLEPFKDVEPKRRSNVA